MTQDEVHSKRRVDGVHAAGLTDAQVSIAMLDAVFAWMTRVLA